MSIVSLVIDDILQGSHFSPYPRYEYLPMLYQSKLTPSVYYCRRNFCYRCCYMQGARPGSSIRGVILKLEFKNVCVLIS